MNYFEMEIKWFRYLVIALTFWIGLCRIIVLITYYEVKEIENKTWKKKGKIKRAKYYGEYKRRWGYL